MIKRVVWDVLQTYPPAGMPPGLVDRQPPPGAGHSRPALQDELEGAPRRRPVCLVDRQGHAAGRNSLSRRMASSLGNPAAVGKYPFTVKLS